MNSFRSPMTDPRTRFMSAHGLGLIVTPTLRARFLPDGSVQTTGKFIEGMGMYAKLWPGPVVALLRHTDAADRNLDPVVVDPAELPFALFRVDFAAERELARGLVDAAVVLASLDCDQTGVSQVCRRLGVPCVYAAEYSLETRRQIIIATTKNPLLRIRRTFWANRLEKRLVSCLRLASGVQCNGTPTYEAYEGLTPSPLLYFDTRVTGELVVNDLELDERLEAAIEGFSIRLAFSGRLTAMKGAGHLPAIARHLRERGVRFSLDVYGDGDLKQDLRRKIEREGLSSMVRLRGVADFRSELMPALSREVDLMVLPHPQGDPACTYMETLSAGVPIAGYANDAWSGMLAQMRSTGHEIGVATALGDPAALADAIADLHYDRRRLVAMSRAARAVAEGHTFEATFARRVDHLLSLCRCGDRRSAERVNS